MSKGSKPRPVDKTKYDDNFNKIFGEWKSPREKRIEELRKDLGNCEVALTITPEDHPDYPQIMRIVNLINEELAILGG